MCSRHIAGGFLCSSGSDQRTLADSGQGLYLLVALAAVQQFHSVIQLGLGELLWSALPVVWV